jgi:hypothetical protein
VILYEVFVGDPIGAKGMNSARVAAFVEAIENCDGLNHTLHTSSTLEARLADHPYLNFHFDDKPAARP